MEADEDHVANQDLEGSHWQLCLVYVHDGLEGTSKRRKLKSVQHFGGLYYRNAEALCNEIWHYLDAHYDLESVKAIFVSGHGASWIRQHVEFIPGTVFVLDRFHVAKKIIPIWGDGMISMHLYGKQKNELIAKAYVTLSKKSPSDRWMTQVKTSIKQGKQLSHTIQANMPALGGRRTMLTRALRGLTNAV